jgi:hypothetical protein
MLMNFWFYFVMRISERQTVDGFTVLGLSDTVYTSTLPICAKCPAHLILDLITWTLLDKEYRLLSYSLCCFPHSPVTSSLLGPNILLSTLFSNAVSIRSSLNVSDQVSHPYKTKRQNCGPVNFWISKWKKKDSASNVSKHCLTSVCS